MGNPVVRWEFLSKQPAKIASFYEELFGWKIRHAPELNYRIVETGSQGGINGGIVAPQCEDPPPGNTTVYIAVDDLAAYRKRVLAAGGKILIEEHAVPGMGAFSLFADPDGRMMGLWKANQ